MTEVQTRELGTRNDGKPVSQLHLDLVCSAKVGDTVSFLVGKRTVVGKVKTTLPAVPALMVFMLGDDIGGGVVDQHNIVSLKVA